MTIMRPLLNRRPGLEAEFHRDLSSQVAAQVAEPRRPGGCVSGSRRHGLRTGSLASTSQSLDQGPPAMIASGSRYRRGEGASLMRVGGVRETRDLTVGDEAVVANLPIREAGVALLPVGEGRLVAPVV